MAPTGMKSTAIFGMTRPINLALLVFILYVIQYHVIQAYGSGPFLTVYQFALVVIMTTSVAAAGYVINDIHDIQIDKINKPGKNIVGTILSLPQAWLFYWTVTLFGAVSSLLLIPAYSYMGPVIFSGSTLGLWWYSSNLKKLPVAGNFAVSFFCAMVVFVLWIPQTETIKAELSLTSQDLIYGYMLFAFLATMSREIIKDLEDIQGDRASGARTLPIAWGINKSRILALIICIVLACILILWQIAFWKVLGIVPVLFLGLCVFAPLCFVCVMLARSGHQTTFQKTSRILKFAMAMGTIYLLIL